MHMQCHLAECVPDFGPISGVFRLRGSIDDLPTNNCSVELQVMKQFISDDSIAAQLFQ